MIPSKARMVTAPRESVVLERGPQALAIGSRRPRPFICPWPMAAYATSPRPLLTWAFPWPCGPEAWGVHPNTRHVALARGLGPGDGASLWPASTRGQARPVAQLNSLPQWGHRLVRGLVLLVRTPSTKPAPRMLVGSANMPMPNTAMRDAKSLPAGVMGYTSP